MDFSSYLVSFSSIYGEASFRAVYLYKEVVDTTAVLTSVATAAQVPPSTYYGSMLRRGLRH